MGQTSRTGPTLDILRRKEGKTRRKDLQTGQEKPVSACAGVTHSERERELGGGTCGVPALAGVRGMQLTDTGWHSLFFFPTWPSTTVSSSFPLCHISADLRATGSLSPIKSGHFWLLTTHAQLPNTPCGPVENFGLTFIDASDFLPCRYDSCTEEKLCPFFHFPPAGH